MDVLTSKLYGALIGVLNAQIPANTYVNGAVFSQLDNQTRQNAFDAMVEYQTAWSRDSDALEEHFARNA